jgi:quinol monooxygenase YgiN
MYKKGEMKMIMVIAKSYVPEDPQGKMMELAKEIESLAKENKGCLKYETYKDINKPDVIIMIEEWVDMDALNSHKNSDYYKRIVKESFDYIQQNGLEVKPPEVSICEKL